MDTDARGGQARTPGRAHLPPPRGRVPPASVLGTARGGVLPEERCTDRSLAAAGDVEGGGKAAHDGAGGTACWFVAVVGIVLVFSLEHTVYIFIFSVDCSCMVLCFNLYFFRHGDAC